MFDFIDSIMKGCRSMGLEWMDVIATLKVVEEVWKKEKRARRVQEDLVYDDA
jgi:hypothetical protein